MKASERGARRGAAAITRAILFNTSSACFKVPLNSRKRTFSFIVSCRYPYAMDIILKNVIRQIDNYYKNNNKQQDNYIQYVKLIKCHRVTHTGVLYS